MPLEILGELPEEELPDSGLETVGQLPEPGWLEVMAGVPTRAGLGFIEAAGGGMQLMGDLLRVESLSDLGAEVGKNARGARQDETPVGMTLGQEVVSGGLESAAQMLPALVVAPASIPAAGIALAAGTAGASRYGELREEGFSGGRAAFHAGIDAFAEGLGEKIALPVLAQAGRPLLGMFTTFVKRDLVGEEATTVMQQANAMLSDRPDMTWGEFLQGMAMTALVSPVAAGAQFGAYAGIRGARSALTPSAAMPAEPPPQQGAAVPPGPSAQSPEQPAPPAEIPPAAAPASPGATPEPTGPLGKFGQGWSPDTGTGNFIHDQHGATIMPSPSGNNKFVLMSPSGRVLDEVDSPADAAALAANWGWNEPLPAGWSWNLDMHPEFFEPTPTGEAMIWRAAPPITNYGIPAWSLFAPDNKLVMDVKGSSQDALTQFRDYIAKNPYNPQTPGPAMQPNPPSPADTFADMTQLTPEEMLTSGLLPDPRMYQTFLPNVKVTQGGARGIWNVTTPEPLFGLTIDHSNLSTEDALNLLAMRTSIDVRKLSPDEFLRIYDQGLLNTATVAPEQLDQASRAVRDRFDGPVNPGEGLLERITQLSRSRIAEFGEGAPGGSPEAGIGLMDQSHRTAVQAGIPPILKGIIGRDFHVPADKNLEALAPGVYRDSVLSNPLVTKVQAALSRTLKEFAPNVRIILRDANNKNPSMEGVTGGATRVSEHTYIIQLDTLKTPRAGLEGDTFVSAFHELGHIVLMERFGQAPAHVKARIIASWLENTSNVTKNTAFGAYMLEHHFRPRNHRHRKLRELTPDASHYMQSLSEYLADQAAAYFMYRDQVDQQHDSVVWTWIGNMMRELENLYHKFKVTFRENREFYQWLDVLAGGPRKASSQPAPKQGPGPTASSIKKGKKPKENLPKHRYHAEAMIHHMGQIFDALVEAGATKEEMDALTSDTGLVKDFRWLDAYALLDKYGVHPRLYGGKRFANLADDSLGFREALANMNRQLGGQDTELRMALAESTAAVKSFNWVLQKTMTAVQLRKRFGEMVPGVKNFVDNLEKMFAYRSRWKERADDRIKEMQKLSKKMRPKVFNVLLEEDASGEFASTITTGPKGRIFTLKPEVAKAHGLDEAGVALYAKIREDFDAALTEMEFQAEEELHRLYGQGQPLVDSLRELHDAFDAMKARPYVPHTRFGEHTVSVRDPEGKLLEFYQFESEFDAKRAETKLRSEADKGRVVSRGKMTEAQRIMMGLPPQLVRAMKTQLKLSPEQITDFENILKDMTNAASFVRRFKRRKDLPGWLDEADDFPRAYADYMSRFANHVSRIKYNHILSGAVAEVRAQGREEAKQGRNTVQVNDLGNWLERLHDYVNDPGQEFTNYRAAATIWFLGLHVKSALVNSTSVPMVTVPYLSQRYGWARAFAAVTQAYKDVVKMYLRPDAMTAEERKMLDHLRAKNKVDQSFASELAGLREGGRLSDQASLSKWKANAFGIKYYSMWLFQKVEVVNRTVTAVAAYRLSRRPGNYDPNDPDGFDQSAANFASSAIDDTQNENAQWNRAELMRGRKSLLTMFMSYQQNLIYQMLGGDQSWMRLLAVQMMVGGLLGIPFAKDIDELIKWFAREVFGSDWQAEKAMRAYLKDVTGNPEWFIRGLSHNVFGLDLSGSLSQGRVIPGIDALAMEGDFADRLANAASDVGGAGFSIILNAMRAASSNDPDLWKRASRMVPEFARSAYEGAEMLAQGRAVDSQGRLVAHTNTAEGLARMLGFQVTSVTNERIKRFAQKDVAAYWLSRRAYVLSKYEKALRSNDSVERQDALAALYEYNKEAPEAALRITNKQLKQSMKRRQKSDEQVESGRAPSRTQQGIYDRTGRLFGGS